MRRRVGSHRPLRTRAEEIGTSSFGVHMQISALTAHKNERGAASSGRGRVHPGRTTSWARGRLPHVRGAPSLASAEADDTGPERPRHWTFPSE
ncbi:hypothetical protein NPIL_472531 [Nephila pilipes]|uniref:Uncharacterized protein n=1 Tax=Nephila pilipes TaxID=299642 RepID=A0A8X6Q0X4_NEPPI|nr:hypothetical protein NPIL_472531 [Nephila pilipes]